MNTPKTNFEMKQQMTKYLFQELFLIQIQLERYRNLSGYFYEEIVDLIRVIDQLMEFLMSQFIL